MAKTIIISSQNENKLKEFEYFFNDYYSIGYDAGYDNENVIRAKIWIK